jgi:haloalkane dehalogenase
MRADAVSHTHTLTVRDSTMHWVDTGPVADPQAPVLVFLHGNPTSSYLWRHVMAALAGRFRCVAVDLIGMGGSGKPDIDYTWADQRHYLTAALDALDVEDAEVRLVMHDWGVALGLDYARHHPERVAGVAMMEGHLRPLTSWDEFDDAGRALFAELRDPVRGRRMIEEENLFLTTVLPSGMHHELTEDERAAYLAPFPTPRSRRPIWAWVRSIPIGGDPPDVRDAVAANLDWLASTSVPRLLLHADPGAVLDSAAVADLAARCPGLVTRSVGPGLHFLPEDQPDAIAALLAAWAGG